MGLKIATTATFIAGLAFLLRLMFLLGERPSAEAGRRILAEWARDAVLWFGATTFLFLASAVLAALVVRQAKRQFIAEEQENLRGLVEGTLRDHERKRNG